MVEMLSALLTPIIAATTAWIAYQQMDTNRRKLDAELYDRRQKVYVETRKFLEVIFASCKPTLDDIINFRKSTWEADFLFENDINDYLDELRSHAEALMILSDQYTRYVDGSEEPPQDLDSMKMVREHCNEKEWFMIQAHAISDKFKNYLTLQHKRGARWF